MLHDGLHFCPMISHKEIWWLLIMNNEKINYLRKKINLYPIKEAENEEIKKWNTITCLCNSIKRTTLEERDDMWFTIVPKFVAEDYKWVKRKRSLKFPTINLIFYLCVSQSCWTLNSTHTGEGGWGVDCMFKKNLSLKIFLS